jgi:hypothetical protein
VLAKELAYYRANFREAIQKDDVVCLERGAILKYLPGHLCKHNLSSQESKAKWWYKRTTLFEHPQKKESQRYRNDALETNPTRYAQESNSGSPGVMALSSRTGTVNTGFQH